jgi:hypothetical protein
MVIKVARQIDALSLCVMPTGCQGDPAKKRGISMFPDWLGNMPEKR